MKLSVTHRWLDANTLLLRIAGLVALLGIPFKRLPQHFEGLLPLHLARTSHLASLLLGVALLYIATQVALRKVNSWYLAVSVLIVMVLMELLHFRNPLQLLLYVATLAMLVKSRAQFVVQSDTISLKRGLIVGAGLFLAMLLLVATTFTVINFRAFGRNYSFSETASITAHELIGRQDAVGPVHLKRYDRMLLELLRLSALGMAMIVIASLFRPLQLRWSVSPVHRAHARQLLQRYSDSPEDYFKLWPDDKHYYFFGESFVAYAVTNGVALVLDGASGKPEDLDGLRQSFLRYAQLNGWQVAVLHASEDESNAWQPGMKRLFIGSEAYVETDDFVAHIVGGKHFRYVRNRATKDNLLHEVWRPPLTTEQLAQLKVVSDAWLNDGSRREYTFMMGYFDDEYLKDCSVVVLKQNDKVVAYTNIIPVFAENVASVDHIRSIPGTSSVAMHFLLMQTISFAAEQGITRFNLGLAPLSKLEEQEDKNLNERLLAVVKQLGSRYYSFAGLEQFKGKFSPTWSPRYITYQSNAYLLNIGAALTSVSSYAPGRRHRYRRLLLLGLAALAAVSYASFLLAVWLNPAHAFSGLVSALGKQDQPYYWLFNNLDIVSSLVTVFVLLMIPRYYRLPEPEKAYRWAIGLAVASSVGNLTAATTPLPNSFEGMTIKQLADAADFQVIIHGLGSFINSTGFVIAALLWSWAWCRRRGAVWRAALALSMLFISTVGYGVGIWLPWTSPLLQRVFIILYAIWLVVFVVDMTTKERTKNTAK